MCGIVGYIGKNKKAKDAVIKGLERLEYRGYDSSGIAYVNDNEVVIQKEKGRIKNLKDEIKLASQNVGQKDYKTVLQEILQKHGDVHIEYKIIKETGPDHDKVFTSEVIYNGKILANGEGKSKKHAEMDAAKHAIELIKKR